MRHLSQRTVLGSLLVVAGVLAAGGVSVRGQQQTEALPAAKQLVAKHIAAIGGEAAFKGVKSLHARGKFELTAQGVSGDLELQAARPNKMLLRVEIPSVGHVESGFDGKNGWSIDPMTGPSLLTGRALSELTEDAWFDSALHSPDRVKEMTTVAKLEYDKRPAYQVKVVFLSGIEQTEYFDAETGLQIGSESQRETPMGVVPTQVIMRDYKKFGPLMQVTTLIQSAMGIDQVFHMESFEYNTVPPTAFDPPPQIKALIK